MKEKPRKVIRLVKKRGPQEDHSFEREMKEMVARLLSILNNAGFKTLIILEKPGEGVAMATNEISHAGISTPVAKLFDDYPMLFKRVIDKTAIVKAIQSKKDKNNTLPPETTIHKKKTGIENWKNSLTISPLCHEKAKADKHLESLVPILPERFLHEKGELNQKKE